MTKCVIFTGGELENPQLLNKKIWENAFIIAADSGYNHAKNLGIVPDLTLGDYDSLGFIPQTSGEVLTFPIEKDDSDLMLAIREALDRGYKDITIVGALGGRFDHTVSNVQSLGFITKHGAVGRIVSEREDIALLVPGEYTVEKNQSRSLSLFSYSEKVTGLSITGVKYPLKNAEINNFFPIGLSNVILNDSATFSFESGLILMILSKL